jgi:hypothetical protein
MFKFSDISKCSLTEPHPKPGDFHDSWIKLYHF